MKKSIATIVLFGILAIVDCINAKICLDHGHFRTGLFCAFAGGFIGWDCLRRLIDLIIDSRNS